ncbi:MAG: hypothetical protein PHU23_19320 [Dehalococcoidales bacterium]|nr:hypothetical protein [Dehalococcoidales bacterium]
MTVLWVGQSPLTHDVIALTDEHWDMLEHLSSSDDPRIRRYWNGAREFLYQINGRNKKYLSQRQIDWFTSLYAHLEVAVNKKEARIAFGLEKEIEGD